MGCLLETSLLSMVCCPVHAAFAQAQAEGWVQVAPVGSVEYDTARVLRAEPVYQTLRATRAEQRCDPVRATPARSPAAEEAARADLDLRRADFPRPDGRGIHGLPAALGSDVLLGRPGCLLYTSRCV